MDFEVRAEKASTVAIPTTKMRMASRGSIQILFFTLMTVSGSLYNRPARHIGSGGRRRQSALKTTFTDESTADFSM